jgi:alpha-N-arabinofuranosidase
MTDPKFPLTRRNMLIGSAVLGSGWALPSLSVFASANAAEGAKLKTLIKANDQRPAISPMIYGGFIEHIGTLINHSLWSEVLDDRKFYYGVLEKEDPMPTERRAARAYVHKWTAIGPMSAVSLDTTDPYVGEHSPAIALTRSEKRGMAQSGLALAGNKTYSGRVVLTSEKEIEVALTLIWGSGANERETVTVPSTRTWTTQTFQFSPKAATTTGRLEITGKGLGKLRVGAVSLMPSDNVKGFRADTLALLKEMDCKILRMPGGNFISAQDWKYTIGDLDKRPPIMDPVWKAVQPNDVGVDELLQMCQTIGCEPFWCANTGFAEPRSGAELVEYVNGAADTVWGAQRAANGHAEPYRVKYWAVGNEMYGHWQFGHMARDQYVIKHNLFVDAMRAVDPSIYIIAPGGFVDEMTTGQGIFIEGQPEVKVGSERDWAYGMLKHSWGKFDALATHAYPPENKRFDLKTGKLFDVEMSLNEWARQPANRVRTMYDAWVEYKKLFPELEKGQVKVFFDEWAFSFTDTLKGALAIALTFHEFFRHTDFIDMAGYTMATGWLNYNRTESVISARGRVFQLYNKHFGSIPVAVDGNSPTPAPEYPIGGDQPRVNAGSATYPLDVSASLTADGKTLVIAVVNATEKPLQLDLGFQGFKAKAEGKYWKFTGDSVDATIDVGQAPGVKTTEGLFDTRAPALTVAPISVEIYHFPTA